MSEISTWSILRTRTLNLISIFGNLRYSLTNRMKMLLHNKNLQKKMLMRLSITGFNTHKNKSSKYRQISIHSTLISWLIFCMSVTLLVFATDCLWFLRILTYHLLTVWKFRKFTLTIISLQNFREINVFCSSKINDTLADFTKYFKWE